MSFSISWVDLGDLSDGGLGDWGMWFCGVKRGM